MHGAISDGSQEVPFSQVAFGESHKLVGGHPSLGGWDPDNAPAMCWNDGDVWTLDLDLPPEEDLEFKVEHHSASSSADLIAVGQQSRCRQLQGSLSKSNLSLPSRTLQLQRMSSLLVLQMSLHMPQPGEIYQASGASRLGLT